MDESCEACQKTASLNEHFDAIFDFMDENDLPYDGLEFVRMNLHANIEMRLRDE